jgi:hypothetical protein
MGPYGFSRRQGVIFGAVEIKVSFCQLCEKGQHPSGRAFAYLLEGVH